MAFKRFVLEVDENDDVEDDGDDWVRMLKSFSRVKDNASRMGSLTLILKSNNFEEKYL